MPKKTTIPFSLALDRTLNDSFWLWKDKKDMDLGHDIEIFWSQIWIWTEQKNLRQLILFNIL